MSEDISPATSLEFVVAPQLALADKEERIIISPAKKKYCRGRPLGAKNKVKGDKTHLLSLQSVQNSKGVN